MRGSLARTVLFAGFDTRQIRPRLPAPGRRVPHQPRQARPYFPKAVPAQPPLPAGLRLWAMDRTALHCKAVRCGPKQLSDGFYKLTNLKAPQPHLCLPQLPIIPLGRCAKPSGNTGGLQAPRWASTALPTPLTPNIAALWPARSRWSKARAKIIAQALALLQRLGTSRQARRIGLSGTAGVGTDAPLWRRCGARHLVPRSRRRRSGRNQHGLTRQRIGRARMSRPLPGRERPGGGRWFN